MIIANSKFARVGLLAVGLVVAGLVGCDSAPTPPSDPSPPMPDTGLPSKGKAFQIPGKGQAAKAKPKS